MTPCERAVLIQEVRQRRAEVKAAGYVDGWTGLHFDALLEEIDSRQAREPLNSAAEIYAERIETIIEAYNNPAQGIVVGYNFRTSDALKLARKIVEAIPELRLATEDPYKQGIQDRAHGRAYNCLRVREAHENAYRAGWHGEPRP